MSENRQNNESTEQQNKYPPRKSKKKKKKPFMGTFPYVLFVLGVSFLISGFALITANDVLALVKPETTVIVEVPKEVSSGQMAKILKEEEVIKYPWAFKLYSALKKTDKYKSGKFELDTGMDYGQIIDNLKRVSTYRDTVKVTIPEGYTLKQIAALMEDSMVCAEEDFLETAATYKYKHEFLKDIPMEENRLEGYLFPDTYEFYKNDKSINVINKMLNNFNEKYSTDVKKLADTTGYNMNEIITIASMIEREAVMAKEQITISGVIHNRLKNSGKYPYLNIDATVQYALGDHKTALTTEDLKIDSPYNTYIYKGLPKGPICNPGMGAIIAAVSPESHKYYYYVATGKDDGSHIFTKTLEEHNAAKAEVAKNK